MIISAFTKLNLIALASSRVAAHLELSSDEFAEYHQKIARNAEALSHCLHSLEIRDLNVHVVVHRDTTLHQLREARGIDVQIADYKRDKPALTKWNGKNHQHPDGQSPDPQGLFGFQWSKDHSLFHAACALSPGAIYGPFWLEGQPERQNIVAWQKGIKMRLALQIIDVSTCKPLQGARVDVWHANARGDYSTTNTSYLRGWQPSSVYGTVDFDSIFPGRYFERAAHAHVAVRPYNQKRVVHSGQLYFDERIRNIVDVSQLLTIPTLYHLDTRQVSP